MRIGDALTAHGLREGPLGKVLLLLAVLAAALLVVRSCGSSRGPIDQEEAVEIARRHVTYEPDGVQVRNVPKGIPARRFWAVSLYEGTATDPTRFTLVEIDAETGEVKRVRRSGP